ncbi:hypothetical protein BGZ74_004709 [Mortierella antarctica]|nr:hypothetical protein BGZ74_004709 [Mortierella antarctica]
MSLSYSLVFGLLMTEMLTFLFLIMPLPFKWRRGLLKFLSESPIASKARFVMKIVFVLVFVLFIDSLNSVIKADELKKKGVQLGHTETAFATKRFYYQRNMYLTGFTLFLSLILNRTFVMLLDLVKSEERMEVVKKQAAQQSKEYTRLLESETALQKELKDLTEIAASHSSTKQDLDNLKKQAKQQQEEYLRMADENTVLQKKIKGSKPENRKDI